MQISHRQNMQAVAWVVVGMSCSALIGGMIKQLGKHQPGMPTMWVITMLTLLMVAPWALRRRAAAIRTQKPGLHLMRSVFNTVSAVGTLYALPRLTLGEITLYQLTTPIWLIPLALIFLGEAVRYLRWVGVAIGFAGVWIVAAPDFSSGISTAVVVVLACAISDALLGVMLKQGQRETPMAIVWWTYSGKALLFGLLAGFAVPHFNAAEWMLAGLTAAISVLCMLCFVIGYRTADATIAETGSFVGLLIGPLAGWLMFGETLGAHYWLGAAVLTSGILLALFEPYLKASLWPVRLAEK